MIKDQKKDAGAIASYKEKSSDDFEKNLLQNKFVNKKNFKFSYIDSNTNINKFAKNNLINFSINYNSEQFISFNFNKFNNQKININKSNMQKDKVEYRKTPITLSPNNEIIENNINFQDTFISKNSTNYSSNFSFLNKHDKNFSGLNITSRTNLFNKNSNYKSEINSPDKNNIIIENDQKDRLMVKNKNLEKFSNKSKKNHDKNIKLEDLEEKDTKNETGLINNKFSISDNISFYNNNRKGNNIFKNYKTLKKQKKNLTFINTNQPSNNSILFNQSISLNENNQNTNFSTCTNFNNINVESGMLRIKNKNPINTFSNNFSIDETKRKNLEEKDKTKFSSRINSNDNKKIFSENLLKYQKQIISSKSKIFTQSNPLTDMLNIRSSLNDNFINKLKKNRNSPMDSNDSNKRNLSENFHIRDRNSLDLQLKSTNKFLSNIQNNNISINHKINDNKVNMNFSSQLNKKITNDDNIKKISLSNFQNSIKNNTIETESNNNIKRLDLNLKNKDTKNKFSDFDLRILTSIQKKENELSKSNNIMDRINSIKNKNQSKNKNFKSNSNKIDSSSNKKKIIYTKKDNFAIMYKNFETDEKANFEVNNDDQQFFKNEFLNRNLISSQTNKLATKENKSKNSEKQLTKEEKEKLDNYFLGIEEGKQTYNKSSYDNGFFVIEKTINNDDEIIRNQTNDEKNSLKEISKKLNSFDFTNNNNKIPLIYK